MTSSAYTDEQVLAAVSAIAEGDALRRAESAVAAAAPHLQRVLAGALAEAEWFGETHEAEVLKAATVPDTGERLSAVRTLLAEETRLGMMVGVAVGWAIADQLREQRDDQTGAAPSGSEKEE